MNRREILKLLAGSSLGARINAQPRFRDDPFQLGVASGDPSPDGVVLWTRLAPRPLEGGGMPPEAVPVEWRVAADERMSRVVAWGTAMASPDLAHSVHIEVRGLAPGRWYWYQFFAGGAPNRVASPIGRTRVAPEMGTSHDLRFAFASCQRYEDGFYTAYRHMAEEELDLVVHLGDYIYEGASGKNTARPHELPEAFTLDDYRRRYALYKSDPHLQQAHAHFPWALVWDDHEVSNNYASLIPEDGSAGGAFAERRAAAYQAYYEHLPLRVPGRPTGPNLRIHRQLRFGSLANLYMLDTRQHRSDQPCGDRLKPPCQEREDVSATLLGAEQEKWLFDTLEQSEARWNILAQQVIFAEFDLDPGAGERYSMDKWDGYPAARDRLIAFIEQRRLSNVVVLSGDNHNNWVFDLKRDFRSAKAPVLATEFVGTSISSNGDGSEQSPEYVPALSANPHSKFHNSQRGYVRCAVSEKLWRTDFRVVPYVTTPDAPIQTKASFVVEERRPGALGA